MTTTLNIPTFGDMLPNGFAQVITYKHLNDGGEGVLPHGVVVAGRIDGIEEYIVWGLAHESGQWRTYHGFYTPNLNEALQELERRLEN